MIFFCWERKSFWTIPFGSHNRTDRKKTMVFRAGRKKSTLRSNKKERRREIHSICIQQTCFVSLCIILCADLLMCFSLLLFPPVLSVCILIARWRTDIVRFDYISKFVYIFLLSCAFLSFFLLSSLAIFASSIAFPFQHSNFQSRTLWAHYLLFLLLCMIHTFFRRQ